MCTYICVYICIYIYIYMCVYTYNINETPLRRKQGPWPYEEPLRKATPFGCRYLSNATCLMRPQSFYAHFIVSRITANCQAMYIYIYIRIISLSLSLSLYIYIYIYGCIHIYVYIHTCLPLLKKACVRQVVLDKSIPLKRITITMTHITMIILLLLLSYLLLVLLISILI